MEQSSAQAAAQRGFANYEKVREQVLGILNGTQRQGEAAPSTYWSEELSGFDYMLEASPLLIGKLRHQSYHLTGLKVYEYRSSQDKLRESFAAKLRELRKADRSNLFIPEHRALGGFGHEIDGELVNIDTLKFYESLIALDKGGVLPALRASEKPIAVEIGSGWGGFAYQMKTVVPQLTYVMVDFPEVFLFSAVYLMTMFPSARTLFVTGEEQFNELQTNATSYDFIFVPQELFNRAWKLPVDLAVNMVSFQEMTTEQVDNYAHRIWQGGVKWLYSHNRERSKHNKELSFVSQILGRYYQLQTIPVLSGSYTDLNAKLVEPKEKAAPLQASSSSPDAKARIKSLVKDLLVRMGMREPAPAAKPVAEKKGKELHWMDYRHYVGTSLPHLQGQA